MAWKFVPTDDFDLVYLEGLRKWFMQDLRACNDWRNLLNSYPYALGKKKDTIKLADEDLKVSRENLEKCIEAIRITKAKETFNPLNGPKPVLKDKKI